MRCYTAAQPGASVLFHCTSLRCHSIAAQNFATVLRYTAVALPRQAVGEQFCSYLCHCCALHSHCVASLIYTLPSECKALLYLAVEMQSTTVPPHSLLGATVPRHRERRFALPYHSGEVPSLFWTLQMQRVTTNSPYVATYFSAGPCLAVTLPHCAPRSDSMPLLRSA